MKSWYRLLSIKINGILTKVKRIHKILLFFRLFVRTSLSVVLIEEATGPTLLHNLKTPCTVSLPLLQPDRVDLFPGPRCTSSDRKGLSRVSTILVLTRLESPDILVLPSGRDSGSVLSTSSTIFNPKIRTQRSGVHLRSFPLVPLRPLSFPFPSDTYVVFLQRQG